MKTYIFLIVTILIAIAVAFYFHNKTVQLQSQLDSTRPDTVMVPSKTTIIVDTVIISPKKISTVTVKRGSIGTEEKLSSVLNLGNSEETYISDTTKPQLVETHYQQGITEFEDKHSFGRYGSLKLSGSVRWPTGETRLIYNFTPPAKRWGFRPLAGILGDAFVGIEVDHGGTFSFAPLYKFSNEKDLLSRLGFYLKFNF